MAHANDLQNRFSVLAAVLSCLLAPAFVSAQVSWTQKSNMLVGTYYPVVCWAGDKLIAGTDYGAILTSADASKWTTQTSGTAQGLHRITWTGSQAIAVGDSGVILTSPDGIVWTGQNSGTLRNLNGIVQAGSKIVAVGDSGTILISSTGAVWSPASSGTTQALRGVAWTGSQIVVVGDGTILTSTTGATWMPHDSIFGALNADWRKDVMSLQDIVWTGNRLVAVGANSAHVASDNGTDWAREPVGAGDSTPTSAIVWSGKHVVGAGNPGIVSSPDGLAWTIQQFSSPYTLNSITWTGSEYVAVSISGEVYVSPDASTTAIKSASRYNGDNCPAGYNISCIGYNGELAVYSLNGRLIHTSSFAATALKSDLLKSAQMSPARGAYYYCFLKDGQVIDKGKFVVK